MPATLVSCLAVALTVGQVSVTPIPKQEVEYQQKVFQKWWGQELTMKFADIPEEGKVPDFRVPYSGWDYPDKRGGTVSAMGKYDRAFYRGRTLAMHWEEEDISAHRNGKKETVERVIGFGFRGRFSRRITEQVNRVPYWYGHCNGWTAAAMRHAEPKKSVSRNGVVFSPSDIKGLLAEVYMYTESEFLGGNDPIIHPALLHVVLGNWLGRGSHPVAMESAVGEVVINYPIYSYKSTIHKHSDRLIEVQMTATYRMNTDREVDVAPDLKRQIYFHYSLNLDADGNVIGGRYYNNSGQIDMLWAPLQPIQGGQKGHERGNPFLNVKEVLALWRESVPKEVRDQWLNIDPTKEDRVLSPDEEARVLAEEARAEQEKSDLEKAAKEKAAKEKEEKEKAVREKLEKARRERETRAVPTPS